MRKKIVPQKALDIKASFSKKSLNLSRSRPTTLKMPLLVLKTVAVFLILTLFLRSAEAPGRLQRAQAEEQTSGESIENSAERRTELEKQLADLENQIEEHQKTIETYQKQSKTLKNEINALNSKISKLNLQIKSINIQLTKLNQDINETQRKINFSENRISYYKDALTQSIRTLYEADSQTLIEILLANSRLSDFFANLNNMSLMQNNLRVALAEIVKLREELVAQKEELSLAKEDAENLKTIQQSQKKNIENIQAEKSNLLKITKGKETEYQKLLQKTRETAAQIRSRIFELLGGGELTFEKAYEYAKLAERATGVRAAMILAILSRESLLGKNTGRCSYETAMSPKDKPIFLAILSKLNIDPNSTIAKVSCPNQDGYFGGAMGPAQFIPSTWILYEKDIEKITGNKPPNPWNNSDAFVATALYLKKFGADDQTASSERKSAAIYYCGASRWQRYACSVYASRVIETANKFQKDIEILNS